MAFVWLVDLARSIILLVIEKIKRMINFVIFSNEPSDCTNND